MARADCAAVRQGIGTTEIMRATGKAKTCVGRWQQRFMEAGTDGLLVDKTRPSRIPSLGDAVTERVVALTLTEPQDEVMHWTAAAVSAACKISVSSVHRIWRSQSLRPHQIRQFKLSNDPQFAAKSAGRGRPTTIFRATGPSVHNMALTLERVGLIRRESGRARSIGVLINPSALPRYGPAKSKLLKPLCKVIVRSQRRLRWMPDPTPTNCAGSMDVARVTALSRIAASLLEQRAVDRVGAAAPAAR